MAKEVVNRQVSVFIESGAAQAALDRLLVKQKSLTAELDKTADPRRQRELRRELDRLAEPIDRATKKLRGELEPSFQDLQRTAARLNRELRTMSASDSGFKALAQQAAKANKELEAARAKITGIQKEIEGASLSSGLGAMWGAFTGTLAANALNWVRQIGTELYLAGREATGVRRAFDRLNEPGLLDNLRKATKGTVSDLELMKRAVSASQFQIPLENLGTYLAFAQARARETGQDVDYLVDSIVTGLGRKSPLILDNLGISAARLSEEFKKSGDFGAAAAKIINEEMAKMGPSVDDASDRLDRLSAKFKNMITEAGEGLSGMLVWAMDALEFHFGDIQTKGAQLADKAVQEVAKKNEAFRQRELSVLKYYQDQYAKVDQAGRQKLIDQVRAEIKITEEEERKARERGLQLLANQMDWKKQLWENYLKDIESGSLGGSTNSLEAMENELQVLNQMLKKQDVSSKKFRETQKAIADLQKKIDDATGKTAADAKRKSEEAQRKMDALRKQLAEFDNELRKSKLGAIYGDMVAAYAAVNDEARKKMEEVQGFFNKGLISQEQYEQRIKDIEIVLESKVTELNQKFAKKPVIVPVRADMQAVTEADALKQFDEIVKKHGPKIEAGLNELAAGFQLDVIKADTLKKRLQAELSLLDFQKSQELTAKDLTENEKLLIEEQYRQKRKELEQSHQMAMVDGIMQLANQAVSAFQAIGQIFSANESNQIAQLEKSNERKKASYDRMLADNLISQKEYNKKIAELDKETDKKKQALERKQFERNKKAQIAQALMSGAMAVVSTLAARPGALDILSLGAFRAVSIALVAATTAAQIAVIAKQKPSFGRGGRTKGPSHSENNGMPVTNPKTGEVQAWLEGDEGIVNKRSMRDRRKYTVTGTPSEIASAINSLNGYGVNWQPGATIKPFWRTLPPKRINYAAVNNSYQQRMFATGGVFNSSQSGGSTPSANDELLASLNATVSELQNTLANLQESGIRAFTYLTDIEEQQDRINNIRKEATMK